MLPNFSIAGESFYTYPLFIGICWALAFILIKRENVLNNKRQFILFFIGLFGSSWVGAKLLYLLSVSSSVSSYPEFWSGGGFVYFGGLLSGVIYTYLFFTISKIPLIKLNKFVPILVLVHGVGRVGCFLSGCCFGTLVSEGLLTGFRHPTQLYEAFFLFSLYYFLRKRLASGLPVIITYLLGYSIFRFFIEFLRGDSYRGFVFPEFSTSQFIAVIILAVLFLIASVRKLSHRLL